VPVRIDAPTAFEGVGKAPILTVAKTVAAADGIAASTFSVEKRVVLHGVNYRTAVEAEDVVVDEVPATRFSVTLTPPGGMILLVQ